MPRHRSQSGRELTGRRRTVYFQSDDVEKRYAELYPYMLMMDVGLRVMPLGERFTERAFSVELEPASERLENILSEALHSHGSDTLSSATCHFLKECTQIVMAFGRAVYEIVYLRDGAGSIARIEFAYVPPMSIEVSDRWVLQTIPADVAAEREIPPVIRIPRADVILFEPPIPTKKFQRMVDALAEIGRPELPEFVERAFRGEAQIDWSSSEDIRFKTLAIAEVSREIGWDARGLIKDEFLEYYAIVRRLRFESFLARLRQSLFGSLNAALIPIGTAVGETGRLVVTGLPTEDDVLAARRLLEQGLVDFKAVIAPFSLL